MKYQMSGFIDSSQQPQNQPTQRQITLENSGEDDQVHEYKVRALQPQYPPQQHQIQPYLIKEDEKIPLFLIKLWNIVEDPAYFDVIRWDESGYSFHITDPYSFCRNVLPQYFKHNNLNSLIRQLNMYGFRKMTPIERTSLARAESDQDHLEFSHPYFVRDHPELLMNIKRKVPLSKQPHDSAITASTVNVPVKDLSAVFDELRQLRDKQKTMEVKMNDLVKDNELIWRELDHVRGAHLKQQQIVNKLVQFLVALVQPNKQQRLGKRHLLAIDDFQNKKFRGVSDMGEDDSSYSFGSNSLQTIQSNNANEVLDVLLQELASGGIFNNLSSIMRSTRSGSNTSTSNGPIIAEVTDELDQLSTENLQQQSGVPTMGYSHEVQVSEPTSFGDYRNISSPGQRRQSGGKISQIPQQQYVYNVQRPIRKSSHQQQSNTTQPQTVVMVSNPPPSSVTPYVVPTLAPTQQPRSQIVRQAPPIQRPAATIPVHSVVSIPAHTGGAIPQPHSVRAATPQVLFSAPHTQMTLPTQAIQTGVSQVPQLIQYNGQQPTQEIMGQPQPSKDACSPTVNTATSPIIVQPGSHEHPGSNEPTHPMLGTIGVGGDEQGLITPIASNAGGNELQLSDWEEYISNVDDSIKNVHGALGSHWDDHLLDNLLEDYDDPEDQYNYTGQGGRDINVSSGPGNMLQNQGDQPQLSSLPNVPTATPTKLSNSNGKIV